jgi:hypothetical protein
MFRSCTIKNSYTFSYHARRTEDACDAEIDYIPTNADGIALDSFDAIYFLNGLCGSSGAYTCLQDSSGSDNLTCSDADGGWVSTCVLQGTTGVAWCSNFVRLGGTDTYDKVMDCDGPINCT